MNIDEELKNILVDLYCCDLDKRGYLEDEIDTLYNDLDDTEIIKKNLDDFMSPSVVDEFYNSIFFYFSFDDFYGTENDDSYLFVNENCASFATSNFLIAYFIRNYVLFHYNDPTYRKELSVITNTKFSSLKCHYYEDEQAAKKYIRCLIASLADPQIVEENRDLMYKNNDEHLIKELDYRCSQITISLNDLLRNIFMEYFNSIVQQGNTVQEAVLKSAMWLFSDEDVSDTFAKMKLTKNEILAYKKYFRHLMIADTAEDYLNNPIIYSMNSQLDQTTEYNAVASSIYLIEENKDLGSYNRDELLLFVFHYVNLFHDEIKTIDNRYATIKNKQLKLITKYNPSFMLDEL